MKKNQILLAAALALLAGAANAESDQTFYVGVIHIDVNAKMPDFSGPAVPPGVQIRVGGVDTLGFGYAYRFAPNWSAELALGLPPTHKIYGAGVLAPFGQVSAVEQEPPTAFINYHFAEVVPRVRPFVGLGLNYTHFPSTASTPSGNAASGGPTTIKLSDSWGLAWHAGATVALDQRWSLAGTVASADVRSLETATTSYPAAPSTTASTVITFRPMVYTLALGYSF
ncbi:MAG: OmpW family protein [Paucibacter sp.]|nr:OmpW family protein [Roseateles sp.]